MLQAFTASLDEQRRDAPAKAQQSDAAAGGASAAVACAAEPKVKSLPLSSDCTATCRCAVRMLV